MTKTPTPAELRAETRNWLNRGVIPAIAAATRRQWAETTVGLDAWHEAFAAEWDRIAAKHPEKVREAYKRQLDYAVACLANQQPGSDLARFWQDEAAKWDRMMNEIG